MLMYADSLNGGLYLFLEEKTVNVPVNSPYYQKVKNLILSCNNDITKVENEILQTLSEKEKKVQDFAGTDFSIENGELLFRGEVYENEVFKKLLFEAIEKGCKPGPIIRFLEKIEMNPKKESIECLWRWLSNQGVAISEEGDILGFKYVTKVDKNIHPSLFKAGVPFTDSYSQQMAIEFGKPVEIPRHKVVFNPDECASSGLHVGIHSYVRNATYGILVKVNPMDVVSVPRSEYCKIRCCRYTPLRELTQEEKSGDTQIIGSNGFTLPVIEFKDLNLPQQNSNKSAGLMDNLCADHWGDNS